MNINKLSIHIIPFFAYKKELPLKRISMATLGDDGDI